MKKSHLIICSLIVACLLSAVSVFGAENNETSSSSIIDITVPTSVQFVKSADGNIIVPDNTAIVNNSGVGVKVESVQVNTCNDWVVEAYGTDFSDELADSKKFALQLNNETVNEIGALPVAEDNWGIITAGESLALEYNINVPRTKSIQESIAHIIFTVSATDNSTEPSEPVEPVEPSETKKDLTDADEEIALWVYTIDSDTNTATVINYLGETNTDLDLVIPTSFNGAKTVKVQPNGTYTSNWTDYTLKSLTIPKGIEIGGGSSSSNKGFKNLTADTVIIEDECIVGKYAFQSSTIGTYKVGKDIIFNYDSSNGYTPFDGTADTFEIDSDVGKRLLEDVEIKHLVIGPNCKSFGFYCTTYGIESIEGLENLEYIGEYAFSRLPTSFHIDTVTIKATVENRAFYNFNCDNLVFDSSVLNGVPIQSTSNIGTMTINNTDMSGVTSYMGSGVSISTLIIGSGNTYGSKNLFAEISNLSTVILNGDAPKDFVRNSSVQTLEINEGCTSIGDAAFSGCSITSITGLEYVKSIGDSAFSTAFPKNSIIEGIELTDCEIGTEAFYNGTGVMQVNKLKLTNCTVSDYAFSGWSSSRYTTFGTVEIVNSTMGARIFDYDKISDLTIKNSTYTSLYGIGYNATVDKFTTDCDIPAQGLRYSGVSEVAILDGCTSIGDEAFSGCNLTEVELPADCSYKSSSFDSGVVITVRDASANLATLTAEIEIDSEVKVEDNENAEGNKETTEESKETTDGNSNSEGSDSTDEDSSITDEEISKDNSEVDSDANDNTEDDSIIDSEGNISNEGSENNEEGTEDTEDNEGIEDAEDNESSKDSEGSDDITDIEVPEQAEDSTEDSDSEPEQSEDISNSITEGNEDTEEAIKDDIVETDNSVSKDSSSSEESNSSEGSSSATESGSSDTTTSSESSKTTLDDVSNKADKSAESVENSNVSKGSEVSSSTTSSTTTSTSTSDNSSSVSEVSSSKTQTDSSDNGSSKSDSVISSNSKGSDDNE